MPPRCVGRGEAGLGGEAKRVTDEVRLGSLVQHHDNQTTAGKDVLASAWPSLRLNPSIHSKADFGCKEAIL